MSSNIFDRLSFLVLFLVIIFLPIFSLPFTNIPIEASKGLLLVFGLAICVVFWAIARFLDGNIVLPKSWLLASGFFVSLAFLLSALFSVTPQISLFGTLFDIGSFWFIFSAFVLMMMSSIIFRNTKRAKVVLLGAILSSALVLVFQILHLFLPEVLSLGILSGKTGNVLGSWNALGLFSGFAVLMFLLVIEFFPISRLEKILLEVFILLSMFMVAAVNFPLVWTLVGVSSLIIFVYKISITFQVNEEEKRKSFPLVSFMVVLLSLLFFISGQFIGNLLPNRLQISNTEVGPSLGATLTVTKGVLMKDPVFGIGPNRFGEAWSSYKPAVINNTQFWDVSFDSGSGLIPTFMVTTGGIGILAWVLFLVLFLFAGAKSVFSGIKNGINWEMMAFFVLSLYLFISSFFYSSGTVIFLLALAFTGIFVGLASSASGKEVTISFLNDHRKSFFSILALIILIIISVALSFKYIERFVSVSYFGKALTAETIPLAQENINKALSLHTNDLYLRTYAQIHLVKLSSLASKADSLTEEEKAELQVSFEQAINGAQMAVVYNPANYLNHQLLGSIYQAVGSIGVKDSYVKALEAFQGASNINPLNPGLKLAMANASFADGKKKEAKEFAKEALALKGDYIDALLTLAQIARDEGNRSEALSYAQTALFLNPTNKDLIEYVDSLRSSSSSSNTTTDTEGE